VLSLQQQQQLHEHEQIGTDHWQVLSALRLAICMQYKSSETSDWLATSAAAPASEK
jgi:hypothetical protein